MAAVCNFCLHYYQDLQESAPRCHALDWGEDPGYDPCSNAEQAAKYAEIEEWVEAVRRTEREDI